MEIVEKQDRHTAAVRFRTPLGAMADGIGAAFGESAAYLGRIGVPIAGPPFVMYYNMDMNDLDVEAGFPVAAAVPGEGRVKAGVLPGGELATTRHVGPYTTLETSYDALTAFVKERGLSVEEYMYEEYANSPEDTPPERLATDVYFYIKR